jgi:hypothetical protein
MTSDQLCTLQGCRILHFMVHDRVSFGGVMIAVAIIYLWLAEFPLRNRESWAWWALAASGAGGFLSFLAYLGYGYLDTWHGVATLVLLPLYLGGMWRTRDVRRAGRAIVPRFDVRSREGVGRTLLVLATFGICAAGLTIMSVGMTRVFVPQDLEFIGMSAERIRAINAHLVPLIAHDRAGFGGALFSAGLAMLFCATFATPSKSVREALLLAGVAGFATAIGIHPVIGYNNVTHIGPAVFGCVAYFAGLALSVPARHPAGKFATLPTD